MTPCPTDPSEWIARRQEVRAAEWALHQEVIAAARTALVNLQENSHKTTVADIARLIELASRLGRLACGMEAGQLDPATPTVRIEIAAALQRVYGQPLDVLADQVKEPAPALPAAGLTEPPPN